MRKTAKLAICALAALTVVTGCSKKAATEETTTAAETTTAETTAAGETAAPSSEAELSRGTVEKLGEYKGIEVTKADETVTDEEVDNQIQSVLDSNPEMVEVDRAAANGDTVNIDYVGMKDGVAFDGGTAQGTDLELGSGTFIPGFEDGLVGAKKGDELSLNLTFPKDYSNADLAGAAVVFDVTVNSVQEKKDAVLDDAFVQRMSDFNTVDEFKADTRADLEDSKKEYAEQTMQMEILDKILETSEVKVNEVAVAQAVENQMSQLTYMAQMYGMELADYFSAYGTTEADYRDEMKAEAETSFKQMLILEAVAEAEKIEADDASREAVATRNGSDVETLVTNYGQEQIDSAAVQYKTLNFLLENAAIK